MPDSRGLSAKVASVSRWNGWSLRHKESYEGGVRGSLEDTSIGSFSREEPPRYPATRLTESSRYKCMPVSRLSRDGMNLSAGRRYRFSRLRFDPRAQDLLILDPTTHWVSINGKGEIDPCDSTCPMKGSKIEREARSEEQRHRR